MNEFSPEDRVRVERMQRQCELCMTDGYWMTPNMGYVINPDVSEETIRSAFGETLATMNVLAPKYQITNEVFSNEMARIQHPFWLMVLAHTRLAFAMKMAHIKEVAY